MGILFVKAGSSWDTWKMEWTAHIESGRCRVNEREPTWAMIA